MTDASGPWLNEFVIPEHVWKYWWDLGSARSSGKRNYHSSEYLEKDSHELGTIGELHFGRLVGVRPAHDVGPLGDDGFDFKNVDVKATPYNPPWLKVRIEKATADRYHVLVLINRTKKAARYILLRHARQGWRRANPTQRLAKHKMHRLKARRALWPPSYIVRSGLNPDLPPGYDFKPRR